MNPYRSIKLNLFRIDVIVTLSLVIITAACAVKGHVFLAYGVLTCVFLIFFIEMLCEGKDRNIHSEFCCCSCECNTIDNIDEKITFWAIISAISIVLAGLIKGESLLLCTLSGLCIISSCQPHGINFFTYALENRFAKETDRLNCTQEDSTPISEFANIKKLYVQDKCLFTEGTSAVQQIHTYNYSLDITGGCNSIIGEFFQNGRSIRIQNSPTILQLIDIGILCNNGLLQKSNSQKWLKNPLLPTGTPDEKAMLVLAAKAGRYSETIPFSRIVKAENLSETTIKYAVAENRAGEKIIVVTGECDDILNRCDFLMTDTQTLPLSLSDKEYFKDNINNIILSGCRPILAAFCKTEHFSDEMKKLSGLTLVGIYSIESPISKSSVGAIERLKREGINTTLYSTTYDKNTKKLANSIGTSYIEKEDIPDNSIKCFYNENQTNSKVDISYNKDCIPKISLSANGLAILPNFIHTIRKLNISIDAVAVSLVSSAFVICICSLFFTTLGLPVSASPLYIMNYLLITTTFMIISLIFYPYKLGYNHPSKESRLPLDGEELFRCFIRGALCAVLSAKVFTSVLNFTNNSVCAITALLLTTILTQIMSIVENRLTHANTLYTIFEKILFGSLICVLINASTSIEIITNLTGLSQLSFPCLVMIISAAFTCDFLSGIFLIKLK